jgi:CheY-like chemotaxis protein
MARSSRAAPGAGVKLVAISGYGQPADKEQAKAAGFDLHFTKPIDLLALERALSRAGDPGAAPSDADLHREDHLSIRQM